MSTKLNNIKIQPGFEELFSFSNKGEEIEHRAQMISYRILSEVEKICEEKGIKKKDLAKLVDTSASYITQLFRGDKQVNTNIMARFEEALEMLFEVYVKTANESHLDCMVKQLRKDKIEKFQMYNDVYTCYFVEKKQRSKQTNALVEEMIVEEGWTSKKLNKEIA